VECVLLKVAGCGPLKQKALAQLDATTKVGRRCLVALK
jgi:hypothetical protein